ncbi:MAG: hypothetical protein R2847_10540 [Bacteroidia bacterium]
MQLEIYPAAACTGTPTAGTTVTSNTPVCPGETFYFLCQVRPSNQVFLSVAECR